MTVSTTSWAVIAVINGSDRIAAFTIRRTRQEAIAAWRKYYQHPKQWLYYRRAGKVRCSRVTVTETPDA
jgi:hypothetical protein